MLRLRFAPARNDDRKQESPPLWAGVVFPRLPGLPGLPGLPPYAGILVALMYVSLHHKMMYMEKTLIYLRKEELDALRRASARTGRSVDDLVRDAIRRTVLKPPATGPVAIWDGEPKCSSLEHDSVHHEP